MSLTWRDPVATLLVAGAVAITYAQAQNLDWPLLSNWRTASLAVLALGFASCIVVGSNMKEFAKNDWNILGSILGSLAFIVGLLGIIFGSAFWFYSLSLLTVALWALGTAHHLVATPHSIYHVS